MGSKIINFKDLKVEHPNRYKVTDSNGTEDIKKIDFDPGLIYQPGTPESAENFNNIQKNCIYEVAGVRILEGQEEIYDISIDGFNNFEFENLKILMTPNATNTIKGSFVRLNGAKYIIKNRTDSIGVGQIFSGESIFISLHFARKTADVIATLNGGYLGTLRDLNENANSRVSRAGDVMTGKLKAIRSSGLSIGDDGAAPHYAEISGESSYAMLWRREYSEDIADSFIGIRGTDSQSLVYRYNNASLAGKGKYFEQKVYHDGYKPLSDSATKLATARLINGTLFNGVEDITTEKWGTSRNLKIGKSTKAVDGSDNTSYTIDEIGAINKDGETGYINTIASSGEIRIITKGGAGLLGTISDGGYQVGLYDFANHVYGSIFNTITATMISGVQNHIKLNSGNTREPLVVESDMPIIRGRVNGINKWYVGEGLPDELIISNDKYQTNIRLRKEDVYSSKRLIVPDISVNGKKPMLVQEVPKGDFNSYTTDGIYWLSGDSATANAPHPNSGILTVKTDGTGIIGLQVFQPYYSEVMFTRTFANGIFEDWMQPNAPSVTFGKPLVFQTMNVTVGSDTAITFPKAFKLGCIGVYIGNTSSYSGGALLSGIENAQVMSLSASGCVIAGYEIKSNSIAYQNIDISILAVGY